MGRSTGAETALDARSGRFFPPRLAADVITRPRLLQMLEQGHISLLLGPPGGGKSTLMAQYYEQIKTQGQLTPYWLNLSSEDNQPQVLQRRLLAAFSLCEQNLGSEMPDVPARCCGFIDGVDQLENPQALEFLEWFVLSTPLSSQMLLSTTYLRGSQLSRARLSGQLQVLGPSEMRFDAAETLKLLAGDFTPWQAEQINQWVDGWAAGVRLLQHSPQSVDYLLSSQREAALPEQMWSYFEQRVQADLSEQNVMQLMQLSVLERFIPELLAAMPVFVCDWLQIENFIRDGLFVRYLDDKRHWAGTHPALGQFLRQRLHKLNPARVQELKLFAANWFKAHGYLNEALQHAVGLNDVAVAGKIIDEAGALAFDLGGGQNVELGHYISADQAGELPMLFIGQLYERIRSGRWQEAQLVYEQVMDITNGFTHVNSSIDPQILLSWAHLFKVVLFSLDDAAVPSADLERLQHDFNQHVGQEPILVAGLSSVLAYGYVEAWDFPQALVTCNLGLKALEHSGPTKVGVFVRIHKASAALALGRTQEAKETAQEALRLALLLGADDLYEVVCARLIYGVVLYELAELESARTQLELGFKYARSVSGYTRLYAEAYSALASILAGQSYAQANLLLEDASLFASERNLSRLKNYIPVLRLAVLSRTDNLRAALEVVESTGFKTLIATCGDLPHDWAVQIPALLNAAALFLKLVRAKDAEACLKYINMSALLQADCRVRFSFYQLSMRIAFALNRYKAAQEHLLEMLKLASQASLIQRTKGIAAEVFQVKNQVLRHGKTLPDSLAPWLRQLLDRADHSQALRKFSGASAGLLSPRESEIVLLMEEGLISKEIAARLEISEGTVKGHRKRIYEKLGVSSRSQAISRARELLVI